jgi:hypothetical protein
MSNDRFRITGVSPEGTDHEWTGCGWADAGHGKTYTDQDSYLLERRINRAGNMMDWTAWRVEA